MITEEERHVESSRDEAMNDGPSGRPPGTDQAETLNAIAHERYGRPEVLERREVDKSVIEEDHVLVRVHAASVNPVEG